MIVCLLLLSSPPQPERMKEEGKRNLGHVAAKLTQLTLVDASAPVLVYCLQPIRCKYHKFERCSIIQGVFFFTGTPLKVPRTNKLIWARLGVSRPIYVNVDSPNLGFPYFNFLGGYQ